MLSMFDRVTIFLRRERKWRLLRFTLLVGVNFSWETEVSKMELQSMTRYLLASQLHSSEHSYGASRGACQRSGVDPRQCQGIGQLLPENVSKQLCHFSQRNQLFNIGGIHWAFGVWSILFWNSTRRFSRLVVDWVREATTGRAIGRPMNIHWLYCEMPWHCEMTIVDLSAPSVTYSMQAETVVLVLLNHSLQQPTTPTIKKITKNLSTTSKLHFWNI